MKMYKVKDKKTGVEEWRCRHHTFKHGRPYKKYLLPGLEVVDPPIVILAEHSCFLCNQKKTYKLVKSTKETMF